jgi:hypothetical protein
LATLVGVFFNIRVDGNVFPCALEIKTMSSLTTGNKAQTTGAKLKKLTYCSFGDELFKKGVKLQYRVQCIHRTCVMRLDLILSNVASNQNSMSMHLIEFQKTDLYIYIKLPVTVSFSLDWVYSDQQFQTEAFGGELNQNVNHVDFHAVCTQLQLWKSTHIIIEQYAGRPLPCHQYIVQTGIAYCNQTKGFVYAISRLLFHIKIPFKRAGPVLQLVFCFISIMVVNGYLTTSLLKLS